VKNIVTVVSRQRTIRWAEEDAALGVFRYRVFDFSFGAIFNLIDPTED